MSRVDDELELQLRDAFAYRAERTTVTDRAFGETNVVTELSERRRPKPRAAAVVGLAAALIAAVGVTVSISRSGTDEGVVLVPYSDNVEPSAFVDAHATFVPEGFNANQDPQANVLACGAWTETSEGPRCDRVVGETSVLYQTEDFSQTIQVTVLREFGIPSPSGAPTLDVNGHEAWNVGDEGFESITWEGSPGVWLDVAADATIAVDVVLDVARGLELSAVDWNAGPLALVVERVQVPDLVGGTIGTGIGALVSDERTCVFMVPTGFCDPIKLSGPIAVGEYSFDQYVLGLVAPEVGSVEVELVGGQRIPATLFAISGSDLRVFSVIDPGAEVASVHALGASGDGLGSARLIVGPVDDLFVEEPVVEEPVVEEPVVEAPVVEEPVVEAPVVEDPRPEGELTWGTDTSLVAEGTCVNLTWEDPLCLNGAPAAITTGRGFIYGIIDSAGATVDVNGVALPADEVFAYEGRTYFQTNFAFNQDSNVVIRTAAGETVLDQTLPGPRI